MRTLAATICLAAAGTVLADSETPRGMLAPAAPFAAPAPQVLGSPSVADDTFVKVRAGGWLLFQSGTLVVGDPSGGGTSILDLQDTLNQDETDASPIGSVAFAIPTVDILIEAGFLGNYSYNGTTTESISFDGDTYSGNTTTENTYTIYEVNAYYELLEISLFKVHVGGGVRFFDVESSITGTVGGSTQSESESIFLPIPVAAAGARADLGPNFFVQARLAGMYFGDYGSVLDGSLEVGWDFIRNAGIFAGYRAMAAESESFDIELDMDLGGPYAGVELRL